MLLFSFHIDCKYPIFFLDNDNLIYFLSNFNI